MKSKLRFFIALFLLLGLLIRPLAAIRYDSGNDFYSLTNPVMAGFPNTYMLWANIRVDRNSTSGFFVHGGGGVYYLGTDTDGTTLLMNSVTGSALSLNTWYHIAVVNASGAAAARTVYLNGTLDISTTGDQPVSDFYVGNSNNSDWCDCDLAAVKVYTAALSQAEIQREMQTHMSARRANLFAAWPFASFESAVHDFSGNGRTIDTQGGNPGTTTTVGPPIAWGRYSGN